MKFYSKYLIVIVVTLLKPDQTSSNDI